ncbi:MAG: hypothetical protein OXE93_00965 [bacterium]|nr:hypothetical protein [bacterium]
MISASQPPQSSTPAPAASPAQFNLTQDDRINLEHRLTKLETTISNMKWAIGIIIPIISVCATLIAQLVVGG